MAEGINKLKDFVRAKMDEKRLTYRDVAARSADEISHSTVSDIVNGRNSNPSPKILRGLAKGLGVTEEEVFALVRGAVPDDEIATNEGFYRKLKKLSPATRKVAQMQIDAIIDALAASEPNLDYIEDEKQ